LHSPEDFYFILYEELLLRLESFFVYNFDADIRSLFFIDASIEMIEDSVFDFEALQEIPDFTVFLKRLEPKLVKLEFISNKLRNFIFFGIGDDYPECNLFSDDFVFFCHCATLALELLHWRRLCFVLIFDQTIRVKFEVERTKLLDHFRERQKLAFHKCFCGRFGPFFL